MIAGKARKNTDTGRMEVDLLKVNDIEVTWLSEASNNYTNADDNTKQLEARNNIRQIMKEALNKVRP